MANTAKKQTILKVGHSLAVSIPAKVVNRLGLASGQQVNCQIDWDNHRLTLDFPDAKQLSLLVESDDSQ